MTWSFDRQTDFFPSKSTPGVKRKQSCFFCYCYSSMRTFQTIVPSRSVNGKCLLDTNGNISGSNSIQKRLHFLGQIHTNHLNTENICIDMRALFSLLTAGAVHNDHDNIETVNPSNSLKNPATRRLGLDSTPNGTKFVKRKKKIALLTKTHDDSRLHHNVHRGPEHDHSVAEQEIRSRMTLSSHTPFQFVEFEKYHDDSFFQTLNDCLAVFQGDKAKACEKFQCKKCNATSPLLSNAIKDWQTKSLM